MSFPPPPPPPLVPGPVQPPRKSSWVPLVIVGLIGFITIVAGVAAAVMVVMMNRGVFTPPMAHTPPVSEAPPTAASPEVPPSREAEAETPGPAQARVTEPSAPGTPPERGAEAAVVAPGAPDEPRAPRERARPRGEAASREGDDSGDAAPRRPLRVGGAIRPPTKLHDVKPVYPPIAIAARVQGMVIIEATIGPDGKVSDARVLRSIPLLDQAALDAVRQWEYTPTRVNGEAVPVIMTVTTNFALR